MSIVLTNWKAAFVREKGSLPLAAVFLAIYGLAQWARGSYASEDVVSVLGFLLFVGPGFAVLRMQGDVLTKPMLFCLPRYRESLRVLTFSGATICGFAWLLVLTPFRREATAGQMCLNCAGGFLAGIVFCLAMQTPRLILSRQAFAFLNLAAIPLCIIGVIVLPAAYDTPSVWAVLMPVLVTVCAFVWVRLGDVQRIKRGQRSILEDVIERGPRLEPPGTTLPWLEKWLRSQMERQSYLVSGRYGWGEAYAAVSRLLPYWKWILGFVLGCTLVLVYLGQLAASVIFTASGFLAWMQRFPIMSPMLLPGGRRERRDATISTAVVTSLLLLVAASVTVVLSWLLTPLLGGASANRPEALYGGLHPGSVLLTCLLVPWFSALGLLRFKVRFLGEITWTVALVVLVSQFFRVPAVWPARTLAVVAAGVFVGGWLFLLLVLWRASRKWDLVSQRMMSDN